MKIYLYNPETGVYLGEDFIDEPPLKRGDFILPPDATTIAPPPSEPGQVQVFNSREQRWEIHDISALRTKPSNDKINKENSASKESQ